MHFRFYVIEKSELSEFSDYDPKFFDFKHLCFIPIFEILISDFF